MLTFPPVRQHAFALTYEASGTSYRIVVTFDANKNIKSIAWPDMRWSSGDFSRSVDAHWLRTSGGLKNKKDAENIADAVNHLAGTLGSFGFDVAATAIDFDGGGD